MKFKEALLIKYGEISLRGDNRHLYEKRLLRIIRRRLSRFDGLRAMYENGRFLVECDTEEFDYDSVMPIVSKVSGIVALCPCLMTDERGIGEIYEIALFYMNRAYADRPFTFKVKTRRANKSYPMHSQEISAAIGEYIINAMEMSKVDVHNPDVTLCIEIRNHIYIYADTVKSLGGLPYGSSGRGMLLLSGGIDSPVAGFLMAKRGVDVTAVYFHSPPYTSERAKDKVLDLARVLSAYTGYFKLYVVPFTDTQLCLYKQAQPEKLTLLLKRSMLKIAEALGQKEKCHCLITGDSVGQVASQTIQSLAAVESAAAMPILRPLAGMDKQEIIDLARKIETFDISIRPYEDCCTVFAVKHPETKPNKTAVEAAERRVRGLDESVAEAIESAEIFEITEREITERDAPREIFTL
ncbi:MAG: tRNA 4-thiouridine(8) synthase ThiI [Clostridiales bacterium]|nr:tRNA 4-thiouridine(8) synthase ThiI [Clostridiales bacterium]